MIIPSEFPLHRLKEYGEKDVYDALKRLPDDFFVFYHTHIQLRNNTGGFNEKEFDFIVADLRERRFNALLIIEAKAGSFSYIAQTLQWYQGKHDQSGLVDELTGKTHKFANHFNNLLAPVPVGWCLWFSTAQDLNRQWYPPGIAPHQVIDYTGQIEPLQHIQKALDGLRKSIPSRTGSDIQIFENFKKTLLRSSAFFETLRSRFDLDEQKFLALTEDQNNRYRELLDNKRILTRGCAGSGKTIIARKLAEQLASENQKVLFLCFNRRLADTLQHALQNQTENLTVNTFHSFAEENIRKNDAPWWDNEFSQFEKLKGKTDFFEYAVGLKFMESVESIKGTFDALIIDEAQDMKKDWLIALFSLVKPDGRISIFLDEQQNLFQRYTGIPEEHTFTKQKLTENCRNTKRIHNYIAEKTGINSNFREGLPEGIPVKELTYNNYIELSTLLTEQIRFMLTKGNLRPHEIMIMINGMDPELQHLADLSNGEVKIDLLRRDTVPDQNTVYYTSVKSFKGLEAPALILINPEAPVDEKSKARFYTQASRAKNMLVVLQKNQ